MIDLFARSPDAVTEQFDDTTVVLDHGSGIAVTLNAAASCVWDALAAPVDVHQVADRLAQRFGIDRDRATGDARAALEGLLARGLVTRTTTGPAG